MSFLSCKNGPSGGTRKYGIYNTLKNQDYTIHLEVDDLLVLIFYNNSSGVTVNGIKPYGSTPREVPGLTFLPATASTTTYTSGQMGFNCNTPGDYIIRDSGNGSIHASFYAPLQD